MGLQIGSASIAASSLSTAGISRPARSDGTRVSGGDNARPVQEPETPPVQAGFGENSLSPSGAALKTLDSNLAVAREIVPTIVELRERARVTQTERRAEAPANRPVERFTASRQRESVRPAPDPAARNFVDDTDPPGVRERPVESQEAASAPPPSGQDRPAPPPAPANSARIDVSA